MTQTTIECPSCGTKGKGLKPITLESLLTVEALAEAGDLTSYRHCAAQGCDVAYFQAETGNVLTKDAVSVRIGTKESEGLRPVCYCFEHTWESIEDELRASGTTDVIETITAHCRNGEDRCPETNPQGSCCLGNVRRAVKEGKAKLHIIDAPSAHIQGTQPPVAAAQAVPDCCTPAVVEVVASTSGERSGMVAERSGMFAAVGALTAAVLSSACCWLPLLLIGIGAGTTSVAGSFEEYRSLLLVGTAGLLGAGFYFVYFRKEKCEPGSACAVPNPRLKRFNKITLWGATAFAVVFAFFPNYIGTVLELTRAESNVAAASADETTTVFSVEGMTCESCAVHITDSVANLPGTRASVSYAEKTATIFRSDATISDAMIVAAIAEAGYRSTPVGTVTTRYDIEGMTCESCVAHLEHTLSGLPGVSSVTVSYPNKNAVIIAAAGSVANDIVIKAVAEAGYKASVAD